MPTEYTKGVYYILNTRNFKMYIGQSVRIEIRFKSHLGALRSGSHISRGLQADWDAYGESAFEFGILCQHAERSRGCPKLNDIERIFIKAYRTEDPALGYNANLREIRLLTAELRRGTPHPSKGRPRGRRLNTGRDRFVESLLAEQANAAARAYRPS